MDDPPVLLISHGFQPNYEKAFANGLARNGVPITMVTSGRSLVAELDPRINTVPLRGSQDPGRSRFKKAISLIGYVLRLYVFLAISKRRALHLTGMFTTASVPFGLLEVTGYRLLSRRMLLTVHNLLPHDQDSWLNNKLLRLIYRMPDQLVVHTERMRTDLVNEWGITPQRVVVMEHGVDDLPQHPQARQPDTEGRLRLLMFGAVSRYKGIDIALTALMDFQDFPIDLSIVGACRDIGLASELDNLIANVPLPHRAHWKRGYVDEKDVQEVFEGVDAVLLPYRHIDQSGVLLTAYRFGIPVLAFDVGSFARYVMPETGIVITDCTATGLQQGMRLLQAKADQFDRNVVRNMARRYLWEKTVRVLLPFYAEE
ncbi:glycosyltransferase family 4 protein [Thiobacillus sp.]|uniref:glycosyltransferase family 4 protein n=1 Tax=Thiobacillus sp. TaxID=924 RepID=UPI0017FF667F|nr:glycosyltransferase family 4 protein [Thiobacillus sp.]MBC2732591.1 glycosyltransferase family 4 protein [Thiobacillus sp.]MBC2741328.1 glycosyltransferase family 4 protein [Thiobacillus sp.]MBC2759105.1 glycosyltransferase family 4 protein [Thiobacillus sp.]